MSEFDLNGSNCCRKKNLYITETHQYYNISFFFGFTSFNAIQLDVDGNNSINTDIFVELNLCKMWLWGSMKLRLG